MCRTRPSMKRIGKKSVCRSRAEKQSVKNTENWFNLSSLLRPWSRLVTSIASYGKGSACGSTRNSVPACSHHGVVATVEFGFPSTVAQSQSGTRWDVETRHNNQLLRFAVTRGTRYEPTTKPPEHSSLLLEHKPKSQLRLGHGHSQTGLPPRRC